MKKPVFLLAIADYRTSDLHLRELGNELDGIKNALRPAEAAGLCEVVDFADADVDKILDAFRRADGAVVGFHFAGHADGFRLLLEKSAQGPELAAFLGKQKNLRFVFLNGCSTRGQVDELHNKGVSSVIATARAIDDRVAAELAVHFYQRLAEGEGLEAAFYDYETRRRIDGTSKAELYRPEYRGTIDVDGEDGSFPWGFYMKPGAESIRSWNLPTEANDPLFGLPPIPDQYDLPLKPYRYLHWYERCDAEVFFGRGREIRELYQDVCNPGLRPILLIYGQSGVGKSSLLEAGLLPRLEQDFDVAYLRRPADRGLVQGLSDWFGLPADSNGDHWLEAWKTREAKTFKPLILLLDQVEEAITRAISPQELAQFISNIQQVFLRRETRPKGKLILSFRKEYLSEIVRLLRRFEAPYTDVPIERLSREGVIDIVNGLQGNERLRSQYGAQIDPGLADMIAGDLLEDSGSAIAPVLQVLMSRMWDDASALDAAAPAFTEALYQENKRKGMALDDFLQQQIQWIGTSHAEAVASGLLLDLLWVHTTALATGRSNPLSELRKRYGDARMPLIRELLQKCRDAYLLAALPQAPGAAEPAYTLAHDTLALPIRRRYESSSAPGQLAARVLGSLELDKNAEAFKEHPEHFWLNEEQLRLVEAGYAGMRALSPVEDQMIKDSRAALVRRRQARQRVRMAFAGLGLALFGLLAFAWRKERAVRRFYEAESIYYEALRTESEDPTAALAILDKSIVLNPGEKAVDTRFRMLREQLFYREIGRDTSGQVTCAAVAPDGRHWAVATADGANIQLTLYDDQLHARRLVQAGNDITQLHFSNHTEQLLAGGTGYRRLHWLDFEGNDRPPQRKDQQLSQVSGLALSPDSEYALATYLNADSADVWNLSAGQLEYRLALPGQSPARALAFLPEGHGFLMGNERGEIWQYVNFKDKPILVAQQTGKRATLLSVSPGGKYCCGVFGAPGDTAVAILWRISDDTLHWLRNFPLSAPAQSVVFSPDDALLLLGVPEKNAAYLFETASGRAMGALRARRFAPAALGFVADGRSVLSISGDGRFRRWSLPPMLPTMTRSGALAGVFWGKQTEYALLQSDQHLNWYSDPTAVQSNGSSVSGIDAVAAAPLPAAGAILLAGRDGELATALPGNNPPVVWAGNLEWSPEQIWSAPDGKYALACDGEGACALLSPATRQIYRRFDAQGAVNAVAFSPDGAYVATASVASGLQRWRLSDGALLDSLPHHGEPLRAVAIAPDGKTLLSGGESGDLFIWDVATKRCVDTLQQDSRVTALAFAPDGRRFVSADKEGKILWWDMTQRRVYRLYLAPGPDVSVRFLQFSADGQYLMVNGEEELHIWRVDSETMPVYRTSK